MNWGLGVSIGGRGSSVEGLVSRSLMRGMIIDGRKAFLKRVDSMVEDFIYNVLWGGVDVGMCLCKRLISSVLV